MAEAGFTKGPWVAQPSDGLVEWEVRDARDYFIAQVFQGAQPDDSDEENGEANARLIAASPCLYEALKGMADAYVALLLMKAEDPSRFKEPGSPYAKACAALLKASGETK